MARRTREREDWKPDEFRVFSPTRLDRALKKWRRAEPGRRFGQVARHLEIESRTLTYWRTEPKEGQAPVDVGHNKLAKLAAFIGLTVDDLTVPE